MKKFCGISYLKNFIVLNKARGILGGCGGKEREREFFEGRVRDERERKESEMKEEGGERGERGERGESREVRREGRKGRMRESFFSKTTTETKGENDIFDRFPFLFIHSSEGTSLTLKTHISTNE